VTVLTNHPMRHRLTTIIYNHRVSLVECSDATWLAVVVQNWGHEPPVWTERGRFDSAGNWVRLEDQRLVA
jgi:hypothetical protein